MSQALLLTRRCIHFGTSAHSRASLFSRLKCHALKLGPRLLSLARLPTYCMVVMEPVPETTGFKCLYDVKKSVPLSDVRIRRCFESFALPVVQSMHKAGMVHGGLRDVNIFVDLDRGLVMFVDFDWGRVFTHSDPPRYPMDLNRDLPWHKGVQAGGLILPEHDLECLQRSFLM